jgi:hypothetical protein
MFLDLPAEWLYRHGVNLYVAMRVFCTDYRYLVRIAVFATVAAATLLLMRAGLL